MRVLIIVLSDLVSVIIPVYNAKHYLEETINSVLHQTYSNWELILIDNGSTDGSDLIINSYVRKDTRIKCVQIDTNTGGPAVPRNLGIDLAKGDYIAFLDADDLWERHKLKAQLDFMINQNVDIVSTDGQVINSMGTKTGITSNNFRKVQFYRCFMSWKFLFLVFNPISLSSSLIRNNFDIRFREDLHFSSIEDWVFWVDNILCGARFGIMKENLFFYRVLKSSLSGFHGNRQMLKAFHLYSELLVGKKISLIRFMLLINIRFLRVVSNRVKIHGTIILKNIFAN